VGVVNYLSISRSCFAHSWSSSQHENYLLSRIQKCLLVGGHYSIQTFNQSQILCPLERGSLLVGNSVMRSFHCKSIHWTRLCV